MRRIDADALSEHKFQEVEFHGGSLNAAYRQGWNDAIDAIVDNEPPVDAVPVRHGRWIPVYSSDAFGGDEVTWSAHGDPIAYYYCSVCREQARAGEDGESLLTDYCPDCGARMDGKESNG